MDEKNERQNGEVQDKSITTSEEQSVVGENGTEEDDQLKIEVEVPKRIMGKFLSVEQSSRFSGPIPPPELLEQYNKIIPGCAETIIEQFVAQGNHRRELEKLVITGDVRRSNLGLLVGFILSLVTISGSFYVILQGYSIAGLAALLTALGALIGVFVYSQRKRSEERHQKAKELPEGDKD